MNLKLREWIDLVQDWGKWWTVVKMLMDIGYNKMREIP